MSEQNQTGEQVPQAVPAAIRRLIETPGAIERYCAATAEQLRQSTYANGAPILSDGDEQ